MEWSQEEEEEEEEEEEVEEEEDEKGGRGKPRKRKTAYDAVSDSGQASRRPTVFPRTSATRRSK